MNEIWVNQFIETFNDSFEHDKARAFMNESSGEICLVIGNRTVWIDICDATVTGLSNTAED